MRRKKSLYLLLVLVGVLAAGFGFAGMTRTLTIDGTAYIGPDSNNFKVFYSDFEIDTANFVRDVNETDYADEDDVSVTFTDNAGDEITGLTSSGDNLDGKKAVGMHVNLPGGILLHVGDTVVIRFAVKNYGQTGYASAVINTAVPFDTNYKYYECTKGDTETGFDCETNQSTTYTGESNSPLEVLVTEETSNTAWWTAPTSTGSKGIMNPGEKVAYKMTIKYASETEKYLKSDFSISFNATQTDPH